MNYLPYTDLVGWSALDRWYYGVRYAVGCSPDDLWVTYFTSSEEVAAYIRQYGPPDIREVRRTFEAADSARSWEHRVLRRLRVRHNPRWLNWNEGKCPVHDFPHTDEVKAHLSRKQREWLENNEPQAKGKKWSDESRKRKSDSQKAFCQSEDGKRILAETGKKVSAKTKGIPRPWAAETGRNPERIRKAAKKNRGQKRSPETRANIGLGRKRYFERIKNGGDKLPN
jgi:hypothetical protein